MSSAMSSGLIASTATTRPSAAPTCAATTTSVGSTTATRFSSALASRSRASGSLSTSTRLRPIERPCAARKVLAIAPPMSSASTLLKSASITAILSLTFAPPSTATYGRSGPAAQRAEHLQLLHQQEARAARSHQPRERVDARVRAVHRPEGVVDVDVAEPRELAREGLVVGLLLGVEAEVLEQRHAPVAQVVHHLAGAVADAVVGEHDVAAEQVGEALARGGERELRVAALLRAAEVRARAPRGAPPATRCLIVGSASRMRVSSATFPSSVSGTLKSTRTKTRREATSSASTGTMRSSSEAISLPPTRGASSRRACAPRSPTRCRTRSSRTRSRRR